MMWTREFPRARERGRTGFDHPAAANVPTLYGEVGECSTSSCLENIQLEDIHFCGGRFPVPIPGLQAADPVLVKG
jgi:hypothetical protein